MRRPVIAAAITGRTATLRPVRGCCLDDVVDLVERAAVDGRRLRSGVLIGTSRLADVEAYAEAGRWFVVVRSGGAS